MSEQEVRDPRRGSRHPDDEGASLVEDLDDVPSGPRAPRAQLDDVPFADLVAEMIRRLGDDPDREGMRKTPERVEKAMRFLTEGYGLTGAQAIGDALFAEAHRNMIVVKDIEMYSLCEHHLLPFFGTAAVAYIPRGRVVGLSKIPRIVEMYARRLQVQERLTQQVADLLMERLDPKGVGVVVEATHLCAVMRGIRKPGTIMTTSAVLGLFRSNDKTRAEFLAHLERPITG